MELTRLLPRDGEPFGSKKEEGFLFPKTKEKEKKRKVKGLATV